MRDHVAISGIDTSGELDSESHGQRSNSSGILSLGNTRMIGDASTTASEALHAHPVEGQLWMSPAKMPSSNGDCLPFHPIHLML